MKRLALAFLFVCFFLIPQPAAAQVSIQVRDGSGSVLATYGSGVVIFKGSSSVSFAVSSNTVVVSATGSGGVGNITINGHTFSATVLNINSVLPAAASGFQNGIFNFTDSGATGEASVAFPFCANGGSHTGGLVPDPGSGGSASQFLGGDCAFHSVAGSAFYQTVQLNTSPLTQRPILNFSSKFSVTDDSGNTSTDVDLVTPIAIATFAPGVGTNAQILLRIPVTRAYAFPASATLSKASASAAATGSTTFTLTKNGTSFATVNYAASATTGTWTQASTATFAAGDVLEIDGPATADASLADVGITLDGTR